MDGDVDEDEQDDDREEEMGPSRADGDEVEVRRRRAATEVALPLDEVGERFRGEGLFLLLYATLERSWTGLVLVTSIELLLYAVVAGFIARDAGYRYALVESDIST